MISDTRGHARDNPIQLSLKEFRIDRIKSHWIRIKQYAEEALESKYVGEGRESNMKW